MALARGLDPRHTVGVPARDVRQLFHLVLWCMRAGRAEPIIRPSERIAAHCYAAGIDLAEVQEAFSVLAEVLWRHLAGAPADEQLVQALGQGRVRIDTVGLGELLGWSWRFNRTGGPSAP
jgi:hypothetical protein